MDIQSEIDKYQRARTRLVEKLTSKVAAYREQQEAAIAKIDSTIQELGQEKKSRQKEVEKSNSVLNTLS